MLSRKILVVEVNPDVREHLAAAVLSSGARNSSQPFEKELISASDEHSLGPRSLVDSSGSNTHYDIQTAQDGETACRMLRGARDEGDPYGLIFLNVTMPARDAFTVISEVLRIDENIQIVLCVPRDDCSWSEITENTAGRSNIMILKKPFEKAEAVQLALIMTEKFYAEEHLRHSQKMEIIGTLAAGLAHDFKNIISSLQATVSSMEFSLNTDKPLNMLKKELGTDIKIIQDAVLEGVDMVQVLLALSRQQELPLAPVDLNELMERVLSICGRSLSKSVKLKFTPSSGPAVVMAYPIQMEQVFLNLCINADHAMTLMRGENGEQGGALTVEIKGVRYGRTERGNIAEIPPGEYILVSVTDTGIGMRPKTVSQIFDPFFTTKSKEKGTGLGLAMVFSTVRKHKGVIDVNSTPGKGTEFLVYLPAYDSDGKADTQANSKMTKTTLRKNGVRR